jgi:hypothetical protein
MSFTELSNFSVGYHNATGILPPSWVITGNFFAKECPKKG